MRNLLLTLSLLIGATYGYASNWVSINSTNPVPAKKELISSNIQQSTIHFAIDGFNLKTIQTQNGEAQIIDLDHASRLLTEGAPDLVKMTASMVIPDLSRMEVKVISSNFKDFENITIAPSKGNLTRDIDPATIPYQWGKNYQEDNFFPGKLAELRDPYIVRDLRGQTVVVYPFQYNPVTKTLRVYSDITVEVTAVDNNGFNQLSHKPANINTNFHNLYNNQFINYNTTKYTPVDEEGKLLIIAHAPFMDAMAPYIAWKKKIGYDVEMVDVATIGNSSAIKTYIANYYENNDLAFVLLVGDAPQVPSSSTSAGDSDNNYVYINGNDHYPDAFIGRFSAETVAQVETQVQRVVEYESAPVQADWWNTTIGIASSQGPGDDNEYDYTHIRNQQTDFLGAGQTHNPEFFDGSQGGNDQAGNPNANDVKTATNDGASVIIYTGHGSDNAFVTSGFSSSDVNQLTNAGKLPFIWSVACVNGNFVNQTCFGEAWLRATDNDGNPTGAIAIMASTINQSWNPPMEGQDAMTDIITGNYASDTKYTFGGVSFSGCMQMNDEYGADGDKMTDTWTCFGDPTVAVRFLNPANMTVTHNPTIFIGSTEFTVNCPVENAKVVLSHDGELVGQGKISGGTATINFDPITFSGNLDIVVMGFNKMPYTAQIEAIPASGPYVVFNEYTINNATASLNYGETAQLNFTMKNVGIETATSVNVTISTDDEFVTINDATENFGNITAGASSTIENAFKITAANNIPDNHVVSFNVSATGQSTWTSSFTVTAHAGVFNYDSYVINDNNGGNGNNKLDPGETVQLTITVNNNGSADIADAVAKLTSSDSHITITTETQNIGNINAAQNGEVTFQIAADAATPTGHLAEFNLNLTASKDLALDAPLSTVVGQIPVCFIDLDGNHNSVPKMEAALNELGIAFESVTNMPEDLNLYSSIFVSLGIYSSTHTLTAAEGQKLADYLNAGGNLYMEGGDTWAYDTPTAVHALFNINGENDGSSDLASIQGQAGSLAEGMTFAYSGENSYIDHLAPLTTAVLVFKNSSPAYGNAVSFEGTNYKTIGASFEFGGLTDGAATKTQLMEKYLIFFGMVSAGPTANFMADNTTICKDGTVQFTDLSSGGDVTAYEWTFEGGTPASSTEASPEVTYAAAGDFNVTLKATFGDVVKELNKTDFIHVITAPAAPATPEGPTSLDVEYDPTSVYTIDAVASATSYTWELTPANAGTISGNGTSATVTWSLQFEGDAYVKVKASNDCGDSQFSDELDIDVDNTVGIYENGNELGLRLYPNPNSGSFTLELNSNKTVMVSVVDMMGKAVYQQQVTLNGNYKETIQLQNLNAGLYFLTITGEETQIQQKLIIR